MKPQSRKKPDLSLIDVHKEHDVKEDELVESVELEKNYRRLFELAPDATLLINYEADIVLANQMAATLFGYEQRELTQLNFKQLVSNSVLNKLFLENSRQVDDDVLHTLKQYDDFQGATKDGKQFPIEVSFVRLIISEQEHISVVVRDISSYQVSHLALMENEERFRLLFDEVMTGLIVQNVNAVIQDVNQAFCSLLGYEKEELVGTSITNYTHDGRNPKALKIYRQLISGEIEHYIAERRYIHKQGEEIWTKIKVLALWDETGACKSILVYVLDITRPKEMELELRKQHNLLNAIIEGTKDSIFVKDNDGRYQLINKAGAKYLGKSKEEIIGKTEFEIFGEELGAEIDKWDKQILQDGKLLDFEEKLIAGGATHWWHTVKGPVIDSDRSIIGKFGISRNISERKRMEEEQLRKDALYRQAEQLGQFGHWELDPISGNLKSCSQQYAEVFGLTVDEALQKLGTKSGWLSFIHVDDQAYVEGVMEKAALTLQARWDIEYRIVKSDGEVRHVHELAIHEYNEGGEIKRSFGVLRDHTDRIAAKLALKESERRYRLLVESMTSGMGALNEKGQFTFVNAQLCEYLGYSEAELIGMNVFELFDDANKEILKRRLEERKQGKDEPYELTWTRKDGQQVTSILGPASLFDADGRHIGSFATVTDITERKKAEQELGLYKQIVSSTSELMSFIDRDCIYRAVNDAYVKVFGKPRENIIGRHVSELHGQQRFENVLKPRLAESFSGKSLRFQFSIELEDGGLRHLESIHTPFRDEQGNILGVVASTRDVTELTEMQQELKTHQESLEEEVRQRTAELTVANEELQAFTHTISHDLKSPLRAVDGFAEWLIEDYSNGMDKTGKQYLSEIQRVASRMDRMIDELLLHARMGERFRVLKSVDFNELVAQLKLDLAGDIKTSGAEIILPRPLPAVIGNQATLDVLLRNLLSNAIKFQQEDKKPIIYIECAEKDKEYQISVKDNGIGINEIHQNMIFSMFERLHNDDDYPGTGVGLALVKKAVLLHQGKISVDSELGEGSTFHFTISKNLEEQKEQ